MEIAVFLCSYLFLEYEGNRVIYTNLFNMNIEIYHFLANVL